MPSSQSTLNFTSPANLTTGPPAATAPEPSWPDGHRQVLDQLDELSRLIGGVSTLFGEPAAFPLEQAAGGIEAAAYRLADTVARIEGRFRDQVADLAQRLSAAHDRAAGSEERERATSALLAAAMLDELRRARKARRALAAWCVEAWELDRRFVFRFLCDHDPDGVLWLRQIKAAIDAEAES